MSPPDGALQKQLVFYTQGTRWCDLYLTEKLLIAKADPKTLLNKRSEIIGMRCHRDVYTNCLNTRGISLFQV